VAAILGLNAYHGDAAAALVVDGELIAAAEEERFNRIKHCAGFPHSAAAWCLEEAGLRPEDLDHVAIGRNPTANLGHKLLSTLTRPPRPGFLKARLANAAKVRDVRAELASSFEVDATVLRARLHAVEHHRAHAASAFLVSPFDEAAVLTVDGFGDFASTMLAHGRDRSLEVLDRVYFPHSLGIFYTAVTQWLGFPHYGDEGKVMGLAPYGTPNQLDTMREIVRLDGLFRLDPSWFRHHREGVDMTWAERTPTVGRLFGERMVEAFGPARDRDEELGPLHHDLAASLQAMLEEAYLHLVRELWDRTRVPALCLAGGVALNAVANGRILPETPFEELYVQPAAGDSGTAVGAAYCVWNEVLDGARRFVMDHAYTGPSYTNDEVASALAAADMGSVELDDDTLCQEVAREIADGAVVGWFQGRMEFGPRALGNRSIVVDPRRSDMKDILNARIKHREPFRPFAPSILAEATGDWFDQTHTSPFMVLVYNVLPEKRDLVPAITHIDGTGRLQTVEEHVNPRYYALIKEFERLTGVPILLNTSFNENEPVVMTPQHAIETFKKTRMDVLVLGNHVVRRESATRPEARAAPSTTAPS
jgi:carbamoyltransferase